MKLGEAIRAVRSALRRAWHFASVEVWDIEVTGISRGQGILVRLVRVVQLVFKGFYEDECPLHASALTFSTLMSIVPVLAVSLALARGFGAAEVAREKAMAAVEGWTATFAEQAATNQRPAMAVGPEGSPPDRMPSEVEFDSTEMGVQIRDMVEQGFDKVEKISFTALGGLALVVLIWMVIAVLGRVEGAFNRVWGVTVGRQLWRRFTDYLSILIVLPILIAAATSLPVAEFATRFLGEANAAWVNAVLGSPLLRNVTIVVMTTLCFGFLIMFMPNTRVHAGAGLTGGFVAGVMFIGWMALCAAIQVGAARYGKIYGSFAIVPILLAWVYISWQIVLFGAEVAFAVQNCGTYRMEQGAERASFRARVILALGLIVEAARTMFERTGRLDVASYAREQRVPVRLLNDVVEELCREGILAEVSETGEEFVLLKAPGKFTVAELLNAMHDSGVQPDRVGLGHMDGRVRRVVDEAMDAVDRKVRDVTIRELAEERAA